MTVAAVRTGARSWGNLSLLVAVAGCLALAARPPILWIGLSVTVAVGVAGALAVVAAERTSRILYSLGVTTAAILAFAAIRAAAVVPRAPATPRFAVALVVAAVAQELFFRRFLYGMLAERGPAVAVAGSALLFALVHVPAYGTGALPIDLAAGLVLSWQRWATGSWVSPAAAHAAANLMAIW